MVIVYLIFGGTAILFSTSAIPFYTPTSNAQGAPSILTSPVAYQPLAETVLILLYFFSIKTPWYGVYFTLSTSQRLKTNK